MKAVMIKMGEKNVMTAIPRLNNLQVCKGVCRILGIDHDVYRVHYRHNYGDVRVQVPVEFFKKAEKEIPETDIKRDNIFTMEFRVTIIDEMK